MVVLRSFCILRFIPFGDPFILDLDLVRGSLELGLVVDLLLGVGGYGC